MNDARITELEIRTAFQEDTIAALNDALVSQQQQLDLLRQELARLREHVLTLQPPDTDGYFNASAHEVPPHY